MTSPLRFAIPFVCLTVAVLAPPGASAQEQRSDIWHAQAMTRDEGGGLTITYYWSKARSFRALTILAGRPIITMVNRDWYYVVDELRGVGFAIERSKRALAEDQSGQRPFAQEGYMMIEQGAERVGTRKVAGAEIAVWRLTDAQARREVWTPLNDHTLPLQVAIFDRKRSSEHTVQYVGWTQNLVLTDRFFRPDARFELERMSYEGYLQATTNAQLALPILYGSLLHGVGRSEE